MFALIIGAVRTRTAQAVTVLVLTALAAAVAAAGPWYGIAASARAAAADVTAAPAGQRTVSVRQIVSTNGDPRAALDSFAVAVRALLPIRDVKPTLGLTQAMSVPVGGVGQVMAVDYRDELCGHVRLTGDCPAAAGQVAMTRNTAQQLGLDIGDTVVVRSSPTTEPVQLRITALYEIADPTGAYWSNELFRADGSLDPVFTPLETFSEAELWNPTLAYDVGVPEALIRGDDGYDLGVALRAADLELGRQQLRLVNPTGQILDTITRDRSTIERGVLVAMVQILILAWFAIGLAGRYTGRERRGDAALLKLRGSSRLGMLRLTVGQHLVPMLGGVLVGAPLGYLLALVLAGPVRASGEYAEALARSGAAVGAVLIGGLLVLTLVEVVVLRQPVAVLLRRVPSGRRDWRGDVADVGLLAVAVAGIYQARSDGPDSGLGLIAPVLVALAVALLLARVLGRLADRIGGVALRGGRLRFGLTAVQVSRQPGTDRVFALLIVAVAMFATAVGGWSATRTAGTERSAVELGADRVLTVQANSRTALLRAVRLADPPGRHAMAAVVDLASSPPILAVDSPRLAAVARWRPEYGPVDALAGALAANPLPAALPAITGDRLSLRARNDRAEPVILTAVLQNEATGAAVPVPMGPIPRGTHTVSTPVRGCTAAPGCRFVRWTLLSTKNVEGQTGAPPTDARLTVQALTQQGPAAEILGRQQLGDVARWRSGTSGAALDVAAADGTLTMAVERDDIGFAKLGNEVFAVDAVLPMPIILAGPPSRAWQFADPALYSFGGGGLTPVRVAGSAGVLPVLGTTGLLADLESARRVAAESELGGVFQVWLAPDTPQSTIDALTANGLTVAADESIAARAGRLSEQGPAVAARFALLAAFIGVLLAAATVAVAAAVDRGAQVGQLRALRLQGLSRPTALVAGYAGLVVLIIAGLLGGLIAAAIARPVARVVAPPFTDGWHVIAPPGTLGGAALALAGLAALLVLGLTGLLSVLPLVRRLRGGDR